MAIGMSCSSIAIGGRREDIHVMLEKLKSRLRRSEKPSGGGESLPTGSPPEVPHAPPEARGHDAKALAELKADTAGEKWRREAAERGEKPAEFGGPKGLEPTRYGDWERAGRCVDF